MRNPRDRQIIDALRLASGGGAWTRKEGKNPEGGLNEKGRASLRAQGHDIKRPQPEGGARKDSFCARMKGMKAKLTSSETANDPDSRINKSLRKWNCRADGGSVMDALRLTRGSGGRSDKKKGDEKTTAPEPARRQAPYSRYDDLNRMLKNPPQFESPAHDPQDPKYYVSPEEYEKGIYDDIYGTRYNALAGGGRIGRKKYNLGGGPTLPPTTPAQTSVYDPFINSAYQTFMNRAPDAAGQQYWANQLQSGDASQRELLNSFANSAEFQNLYKTTPERAVSGLYQSAFNRTPDQGGLQYWQQQQQKGMSAQDMLNQFTNSQEFQNVYDINNAYMNYQGAMATPDQLASAHKALASGKTMSDVEGTISSAPEATTNFIKTAYKNMLGRSPEEAGLNYWSNALNSGAADKTDFLNSLASSAEGGNYANTQTLNNLYERFTGKQPDQTILNSPEYSDMLSKMAQGTINVDQIKSIVSKDPYAVNYENTNLVKDTFTALTGKVPAQSVVDDFTSKLAAGTLDSSKMFDQIAATPESQKFVDAKKYAREQLNAPLTPQEQAVIDMISTREGAKDPNAIYGYNRYADKVGYKGNLTEMTPNQIFPMQTQLTKLTRATEGRPSSAVGSGQFIQGTLRSTINDLAKKYGIDKDVLANIEFDPNFQKQVTLQNFRTYVGDPNDPKTWNKYRLGKQWESFDTSKGKKALSQEEINRIINAAAPSTGAPPPVLSTPEGIDSITQSTGETITDGGVGGLGVGAPSTPSMTPISGIGGGIDFSAPSSPPSTYTPPPPHTGISAPISHPPVTHVGGGSHPSSGGHGSFGVGYAPDMGGSGVHHTSGSDPYFGHGYGTNFDPHQIHFNRNTGHFYDSSSDVSWDPNRAGSKKGGAVWDKPRPKSLGKPEKLTSKEKSSAKRMAKAAGRPYPNLVDNMRAAKADGGHVKVKSIADALRLAKHK
jgi:hypothetical protein